MADKMLSPFHIRNLGSSNISSANQDNLVRISAPDYEQTITDNPAAMLKYEDEDRETITLGSSSELMDKLEEPVQQPSESSSRKSKDRMSIAMLLSEAQQNPESLKHHVFDIDEREEIKKLWQEVQQRNKTPPPMPTNRKDIQFWAPAEGALISRLRKESMDWEEISKKMDGRSASDCRFYYGHLMDAKRDQLATVYERRRKPFWASIAAELGIPWEDAENLLWDIGQDDMRNRIRKLKPTQKEPSKDLMSVESVNGDWYGVHPSSTKANADASPFQRLEDYRIHHFNATMPPQLQSYKPTGPAFKTSPARLKSARASLRSLEVNFKANLTTEGKRQAQAAGDILRARTAPSRYRKAAMNVNDHLTHQNRWADYKSSNTPFSTAPLQSIAQDPAKSTLTSEGKRQAQAAGDKLRCRTNPIRHSRPARSGSLEHGVHKNRWASYIAPRAGRFDERDPADAKPGAKSQPEHTEPNTADKQPSLLEVFESELAKDSSIVPTTTEDTEAPDPEISSIPQESTGASSSAKDSNGDPAPAHEAPSRQQANNLFGGIKMIGDLLQGIADVDAPQELSQMLENGVRSAAGGIDDLLRGLTDGLREVPDRPQQAAYRNREADTQGIDDTVKGLQDFVLGLTDGLGALENGSKKDGKNSSNMNKSENSQSRSAGDETHGSSLAGALSREFSRQEQVSKDVRKSVEARKTATGTRPKSNPQQPSKAPTHEEPQRKQKSSDEPNSDDQQGETGAPRYHEPGPIHLPQNATMSKPEISSLVPHAVPGYVDRLRRSETTEQTFAPTESRLGSPPAAASRFPSLAQFESAQNLVRIPSFPALPSMEPLVPQTAANEYKGASDAARSRQSVDSHVVSRYPPIRNQSGQLSMKNGDNARISCYPLIAAARDQQAVQKRYEDDITAGINVSPWESKKVGRGPNWSIPSVHDSVDQLELPEQQNKKPMALDAKDLQNKTPAPSQEQTEGWEPQGYEMQLKLLELQNKKRLLMARQEVESDADYPILPGTFPNEVISSDQISSPVISEASKHSFWPGGPESSRKARPGSAARLVKPFDPLEAEPSAQSQLTEGIRRNATVAGTSSRHNATSRRPYSQAYEGNGRLSWNQFLSDTSPDRDATSNQRWRSQSIREKPAPKSLEDSAQQDRHVPPKRSDFKSKSPPAFVPYNRKSFGHAKAERINQCVDQLRELGYGHEDDGFGDRLNIYAEDADGDLQEAIEMIADEQRAYDEGF